MFSILLSGIHFVLIVALTFINGFWLITLDELEIDHLNPSDVAIKLNKLVVPEWILHGSLMFIYVITFSPWLFLLNLPLAVYMAYKYRKGEHYVDPTEILRYKKLKSTRMEAIGKTVFYGLQIAYAMYWMVSSIVQSVRKPKTTRTRPKFDKTTESPTFDF